MSNTYGKKLKITVFGQSHSPAIGVTCEGLPAGFEIDMDRLSSFMARRAPGKDPTSTPRREADAPEFVSGLVGNTTCGAPLTALIRNTNTRSADYENLRDCPRPGHADFTANVKYGGHQDVAGGGHFSGRLTAPLCIIGGIALQMLEGMGITVGAHIVRIGKEEGKYLGCTDVSKEDLKLLDTFPVRTFDEEERFRAEIAAAKADGDSVGGMIECAILGLPAGLGDPMFDGMENRIARIVFGIPAVKGVEFGRGMGVASIRGSENNDPFTVKDGKVVTTTNNAGGILGGITNGMPLVFRAAIKPTPSIDKEQDSVSLSEMEPKKLTVKGRHDPCIVPRAVPVMEAAAAIAILDAILCR
ncbi:MAG: chorismate synthase [Ruminococcaceae bacterium]|nr:chorismate synthase [Oscillospiraceae bacterium]